MSKKSHHFLTLWPWPLTYDLEKLIRSGHYHYQCVYQIWEQSIPWFFSYRVNTIAGGGRRVAGGGRLRRKPITSPDPSDTGDIIKKAIYNDIYRDSTFDDIHRFCSSIWNTITRENHACAPSQRVIVLSLFILKTKYCYSIEAPGHPTLIDLCWPWLV